MGKLYGKVALVTGAVSLKGFGFATAQLFGEKGAKVVLTGVKVGRGAGARAHGSARDRLMQAWAVLETGNLL